MIRKVWVAGFVACGGAVAADGDAGGTPVLDAGRDAGTDAAVAPRPKVRADLLGEACTGSDECFDVEASCANYDAVDIMPRGPLCAPASPCSIVTCPDGQVCSQSEVEPITVNCVAH
ncbi:MAG: hypothetical protein KIT84_41930 [Labilithrix sp.]|nr:hypothetical protein [Labilithrix sp.]MCW5817634.1 hypothetical protein [Labilithrix sp.]